MSPGKRSPTAFRAHSSCLLSELDDGTGVVLDLRTKVYHKLNTTAVWLWRSLSSGPRTSGELTRSLVEEFEVEESEAAADVEGLLGELLAEGLIAESPVRE